MLNKDFYFDENERLFIIFVFLSVLEKQSECVLNVRVEVCVDIIDNRKRKHNFTMNSLKKINK